MENVHKVNGNSAAVAQAVQHATRRAFWLIVISFCFCCCLNYNLGNLFRHSRRV